MSNRLESTMSYGALKHRMEEVAQFVEAIPPAQFNMEHWWLPDGEAFDDDRNRMYRVSQGPCGCAIGNMVQDGRFGFPRDLLQGTRDSIFPRIADAFAIQLAVAHFIFDSYAYRGHATPQQVARRIRFVAKEMEA